MASVLGLRPRWMADAACHGLDPDMFHPVELVDTFEPLAVCRTCPVRDDCFTYALDHEPDGIWGGTTDKERERIRRANQIRLVPRPTLDVLLAEERAAAEDFELAEQGGDRHVRSP